jgi:hypothetical protein
MSSFLATNSKHIESGAVVVQRDQELHLTEWQVIDYYSEP